ncbi:unnamed protein product [Rhizoctonia solani]|uniref:BTB domain-containing protein n=1 Tax=Rhizoctonia solani TaxID=456999 RepID=A0A8H3HBF5_9AGAM|nr:unnamed protein product [Rhizoctonia solani]
MPPTPPPLVPSSSAALSAALATATETWKNELKNLFEQAEVQYADVVWDIRDQDDLCTNEIWGHKVPHPGALLESPGFYSTQNSLSTPSLSLPLVSSCSQSRSPSPFGASQSSHTPDPSGDNGTLLRVPLMLSPDQFRRQIEYLYAGEVGIVRELWLNVGSTAGSGSAAEMRRRNELRKDLLYMWKNPLYRDVRITVTGGSGSNNREVETADFSSHRFILVSRVPYFRYLLSSAIAPVNQNICSSNPLSLKLPTPPFTPKSLHFIFGFIYTGTLVFSTRPWGLETAFDIVRGAKYLELDTLGNEARARIIAETMHGLFHAYLPFEEYDRLIEGKWGIGGCKCKQCQQHAPRVLMFALELRDDVLERGAQRALVSMYGEGWTTSEFLALPSRWNSAKTQIVGKRSVAHYGTGYARGASVAP